MRQPPWMDFAWAALGIAEQPGSADNAAIKAFFRKAGRGDVVNDEVAWCAAFVGACLADAKVTGTGSLMARSYLQWGRTAETPELGAIAVLRRGSGTASGHVGFLVGETAGDVMLLGGNQSNSVSVAAFPKASLLSIRLPAEFAAASIETATVDRGEDSTDRDETADPAFERALTHVLAMEGGYTDDPYDPGGPTHRGITLATLAAHRRQRLDAESRPQLIAALRALSLDEARTIYRRRYWVPSRAGEMPQGVRLMHFDASVNQGLTGAARLLQQALGIPADGQIGPVTMAALRERPPVSLLAAYAAARRRHYRGLPHAWRFGRGWLARVDRTLAAAQAEAAAHPAHAQTPPQPVGARPMSDGNHPAFNAPSEASPPRRSAPPIPQREDPFGKWWGQSMTIWGAIITTLATVLPALGPLFGLDITGDLIRQLGAEVVKVVQALGGVAGVLMTIYGRARASQPLVRRDVSLRL